LFIKICGLNSLEAIDSALSSGADALGFVFANSPRKVSPTEALSLCKNLPNKIIKVAVTKNPTKELLNEICNVFSPDWIQGEADDVLLYQSENRPTLLPVFRDNQSIINKYPTRILFEGTNSGSSEIANWKKASEIAKKTEVILAGGLNLTNIEKAIRIVSPWGVDISSGVENVPGIKDPKKIRDFINCVRTIERAK
tara:strand:- start:2018 stop:2608 length:591 start_codon:yes stop_codon:yes gene_type:complete